MLVQDQDLHAVLKVQFLDEYHDSKAGQVDQVLTQDQDTKACR